MKQFIYIFIALLVCQISYSQFTTIPDPNFEQTLIDLGLDDVLDGQVLTTNISNVIELDISFEDIEDITGIEDFVALETLDASDNLLTSIDVSNNLNLIFLWVSFNELTSIDLSNNLNLEQVTLDGNQISNLDVSFLDNLASLWIDENLISTLDLSNNPLLDELYCGFNPNLSFINIKNGENEIIEIFDAEEIATNACIQVDDAQAATNASTFPYNQWEVDATAIFSEDCSLSLNNISTSNFVFYPNPIKDYLFIQDISIVGYNIYEVTGKLVESDKMTEKYINLKHLKKGVYLIEFIIDENQKIVKKVVKQ